LLLFCSAVEALAEYTTSEVRLLPTLSRHLGIGDLRLAATHKAEQLLVTHFLATKLGHGTGHQEISALDGLGGRLVLRFLVGFFQIVAIHHIEAIGLLQMRDQDGLGLRAEPGHRKTCRA
jgi:hypothetical protein